MSQPTMECSSDDGSFLPMNTPKANEEGCTSTELGSGLGTVSEGSIEMLSEDEDSVLSTPRTKIEAAREFRLDCVPSTIPVAYHFFCCVCGCPAGHDCFTCEEKGHPVCTLCKEELKIEACPFVLLQKEESLICGYKLYQVKSTFREFMCEHTIVGCMYHNNGCNFQGPWEEVKQHQEVCQYVGE